MRHRLPGHRKAPVGRHVHAPLHDLAKGHRRRIRHRARTPRLRHRQADGAILQHTRPARRPHRIARRPALRHRVDARLQRHLLIVARALAPRRKAEGSRLRCAAVHHLDKGDRPRVARVGQFAVAAVVGRRELDRAAYQRAGAPHIGQRVVGRRRGRYRVNARQHAQVGIARYLFAVNCKAPVARHGCPARHRCVHQHIHGPHIAQAHRRVGRGRSV